jgi:mono/diheme cytochrome c family protein
MRCKSPFMQTFVRRQLRPLFLTVFACLWGVGRAAPDPRAMFDSNCALCHQKGGVGVRGQFPRLAGRIGAIAATPRGRTYLQQVVLFGMAGKIEVDGQSMVGVMPSFAQLSDDDLAALLNYVTSLGAGSGSEKAAAPFTAEELTKTRSSAAMSPTQVNASRVAAVGAGSKAKHAP